MSAILLVLTVLGISVPTYVWVTKPWSRRRLPQHTPELQRLLDLVPQEWSEISDALQELASIRMPAMVARHEDLKKAQVRVDELLVNDELKLRDHGYGGVFWHSERRDYGDHAVTPLQFPWSPKEPIMQDLKVHLIEMRKKLARLKSAREETNRDIKRAELFLNSTESELLTAKLTANGREEFHQSLEAMITSITERSQQLQEGAIEAEKALTEGANVIPIRKVDTK